jgi:hypothetical protein
MLPDRVRMWVGSFLEDVPSWPPALGLWEPVAGHRRVGSAAPTRGGGQRRRHTGVVE